MNELSSGWRISYQRSGEYEILHCPDLLDPGNDALLSVGKVENSRRFVVIDHNVERLHAAELRQYFDCHGVNARIVPVAGGEESKSIDCYLAVLHELDNFPIDRRDEPILAIGGGVVTDLAGFVSATYRRGVPHLRIPTTLLGYVDASVGIKTGLNFNHHKNRLGAFEPPRKVLLQKAFLDTLPKRHILNGVCEILKLAVIRDLRLFELLELHGPHCIATRFQDEHGSLILDSAISGMIAELQPNLYEDDLARRMDFGHTFSYGLETCPGSQLLHGEAVLMDVLLSGAIAMRRQLLSAGEYDRLLALVSSLDIVLTVGDVDPCLLWESLEERTLHRNGWQRLPLPHGIGDCVFVNDVKPDEIGPACSDVMDFVRA